MTLSFADTFHWPLPPSLAHAHRHFDQQKSIKQLLKDFDMDDLTYNVTEENYEYICNEPCHITDSKYSWNSNPVDLKNPEVCYCDTVTFSESWHAPAICEEKNSIMVTEEHIPFLREKAEQIIKLGEGKFHFQIFSFTVFF